MQSSHTVYGSRLIEGHQSALLREKLNEQRILNLEWDLQKSKERFREKLMREKIRVVEQIKDGIEIINFEDYNVVELKGLLIKYLDNVINEIKNPSVHIEITIQ